MDLAVWNDEFGMEFFCCVSFVWHLKIPTTLTLSTFQSACIFLNKIKLMANRFSKSFKSNFTLYSSDRSHLYRSNAIVTLLEAAIFLSVNHITFKLLRNIIAVGIFLS